jgi:endonuclease/exonuclease/phosphatase family metal-dependent hydrolase
MATDQGQGNSNLVAMTLNLQYYSSYPKDEAAAERRLEEVLTAGSPPEVICVQEGLARKNVLSPVGFELKVCASNEGVAQSVHDMVYGDQNALSACDEALHSQLLCNQIYIRKGSPWQLEDSGVEKISSDLQLHCDSGKRANGKLAIRSMLWVKLRRCSFPAVYVMCTHITGGRFEDQYFVQQLVEERYNQLQRIFSFFDYSRPRPQAEDIGILLGDFNATPDYVPGGAMSGYFKSSIGNSEGVQSDAKEAGISNLEEHFKDYMVSPFTAISKHGWICAYGEELGVTSGFGHLIDHMVTNRRLPSEAQVIYLTNQKFGNKPPDTTLPLTDHNSVKTSFRIPYSQEADRPENEVACMAEIEKWFQSNGEPGISLNQLRVVLQRIDPESRNAMDTLLDVFGYGQQDRILWEEFSQLVFSRKPLIAAA